jgi:hypothetical protein
MGHNFGYPGDNFEFGKSAPAHAPSTESDGDPFFHTPVPIPKQQVDFDVHNPANGTVDMDGDIADRPSTETDQPADTLSPMAPNVPVADQKAIIARMEQDFNT